MSAAEPEAEGAAVGRRVRSLRPMPHEVAAAGFVVAGIAVLERLPVVYPRTALFLADWKFVTLVGVVAALVLALSRLAGRRHGAPPALDLVDEALLVARAAATFLLTLAVHFLLKSYIYLVNPRVWDHELARLDQALHLGISPSRFLTTLLAHPAALTALDVVYSLVYYPTLVVASAVLLVRGRPERRLAFAAAYTFLWIAGAILYLALPSWGPVFVPDLSPDFEEVLQRMPLTVSVQAQLYREISTLVADPLAPRLVRFGSVAAFPSLHVAAVALFTIASRGISRRWFQANLLLLALMVVGSVVTGYHYLVDAWAGIALAAGAWWLGRRMFAAR